MEVSFKNERCSLIYKPTSDREEDVHARPTRFPMGAFVCVSTSEYSCTRTRREIASVIRKYDVFKGKEVLFNGHSSTSPHSLKRSSNCPLNAPAITWLKTIRTTTRHVLEHLVLVL